MEDSGSCTRNKNQDWGCGLTYREWGKLRHDSTKGGCGGDVDEDVKVGKRE
jgi:hypothetical protein